jgi:hypothetical protein
MHAKESRAVDLLLDLADLFARGVAGRKRPILPMAISRTATSATATMAMSVQARAI